jgi:hypothetical protein
MPGMGWRSQCVAAAVAVAGMILAAAPSVLASGSAVTKVVYVAPVDSHGRPLPDLKIFIDVRGMCEPGSDSVPGPVYRCFDVGNSVLDPCWADRNQAGSVLCMFEPWSQTVVELDTKGLPASSQPVPKSLSYPWGVKLANGEKCLAAQGAHDQYRGRVIDYSCGKKFRLVLLGGIDQSQEPWTFDSAMWTGKKYIPGPAETVRIAWYGGPSPAATS